LSETDDPLACPVRCGGDGWGHAGTAFDPASLYEVLFQINVNATFGIWIDDVAFTM